MSLVLVVNTIISSIDDNTCLILNTCKSWKPVQFRDNSLQRSYFLYFPSPSFIILVISIKMGYFCSEMHVLLQFILQCHNILVVRLELGVMGINMISQISFDFQWAIKNWSNIRQQNYCVHVTLPINEKCLYQQNCFKTEFWYNLPWNSSGFF